jgi:hypothetical protein
MKTKMITKIAATGLGLLCGLSSWAAGEPAFETSTPFAGADHPRQAGGNVWGDYNNDGKQDVFIFGYGTFKLYQGNGDATFTDVTSTVFGATHPSQLWLGSAAWLDYDKDGALDLIIFGNDGSNDTTILYANSGAPNYTLTAAPGITFPPMQSGNGSATGRLIGVADYDGDTYPDVLLSGKTGSSFVFSLYKNNGDGTGFTLQDAVVDGGNFTQVGRGSVAWGDFNKDGKPDILFNGNTVSPDQRYTGIYKNNGGGSFDFIQLKDSQDRSSTVEQGEVAWIDYDSDGYLDVLITGSGELNGSFEWWTVYLFRNNKGDGTFTQITGHGIGRTCESSVAVGDINKDGYDDVVVIGQYEYGVYYNNEGNGTFLKSKTLTFSGQVTKGMATLVDIDGDEDLDLALVGDYIEPTLYKNEYPTSSRVDYPAFSKTTPFAGAGEPRGCGGVAYADYDKDGNPDAFIYGYGAAKLYHGNGDGTFADSTPAGFPAMLWQGSAAWIDYNGDSWPDLIMTGSDNGALLTRVYKNTAGALAHEAGINLPPMKGQGETTPSSFLAAADYDGDGYQDFVVAAKNASDATVFDLYKNNGDGTGFTRQATAFPDSGGEFPTHFDRSSLAWGDFNSDGKPDILFNGRLANDGGVAGIYSNNGDGAFSLIPLGKGAYEGEVAWLDYDKDGKQDILLTGDYWEGEWQWWNAFLYRNNGDSTFTLISDHGLGGACKSAIAVGDLNGDGYDDVVIIGEATDAVFFNNKGDRTFTKKLATLGLYTTNAEGSYMTGAVQVTRGDVAISDVNSDGKLDVTIVGDNAGAALLYLNLSPEESGEELTTVPPFEGTPFVAVENPVGGTAAFPLNLKKGSGAAWGDYDGDGNLDVLVWGYYDSESATFTKLYKNNGNSTFTDVTTAKLGASFPKIAKGAAAWFDYNNDGRLDLIVAGATTINDDAESQTTVTKVYMNMGPSVEYQLNEMPSISSAFPPFDFEKSGGIARNIAIADYDNDGLQDVLFSARFTDKDLGGAERRFALYRNINGESFELQASAGLEVGNGGGIAWGDFNNDGYQDILFDGYKDGGEGWTFDIYKNNGNGAFTKLSKPVSSAPGLEGGESVWLDYDGDGYLDFIITGDYHTGTDWSFWNTKLFRNNGDETFTEVADHNLRGTNVSSVTWADLDNDGRVDVLFTGQGNSICYNNGDGTFTQDNAILGDHQEGGINVVDYDKDGKLDIFATGQSGALLLHNEGTATPAAPAAPTGFAATSGANGELTLSWAAAADPTLRYNIFVKKELSTTRVFIISLAPVDEATGALKVSYDHLALLTTSSYSLKGIEGGDYTVGVQAVSINGRTSAFATATATVGGGGGGGTSVDKALPGSFAAYKSGEAIVVTTDIAQEAELVVYSVAGTKVWSAIGSLAGDTQIIGLQRGQIYFVTLRVDGKAETRKVAL